MTKTTKHPLNITRLSLIAVSFFFSVNVLAADPAIPTPHKALTYKPQKTPEQYVTVQRSLTLEQYIHGMKRLAEYFESRLPKAPKEDKAFLEKEYAVLKADLANPQKSYETFYATLESRIERFKRFETKFPETLGRDIRHKMYIADDQFQTVKLLNEARRMKGLSDEVYAEIEYQLGNVAYDNTDFKRTLRHLENAVKLAPNQPEYLFALTEHYFRLAKTDAAKATLARTQAALKKAPEFSAVRASLNQLLNKVN